MNDVVANFVDGKNQFSEVGDVFETRNPSNGRHLHWAVRSSMDDLDKAVSAAKRAFPGWSERSSIDRGEVISHFSNLLNERRDELTEAVRLETGKSHKDADAETSAAIQQGYFWSSQRYISSGRELPSAVPGKLSITTREPIGIAGLIVPANTPAPNIAWKLFPALFAGNAVVLKSSELAPKTAYLFAQIAADAGVPDGIINVLHGLGHEIGRAIVRHEAIGVISFTGSTRVGKEIAADAGERLARVSLELGGNNPFIVCADADLNRAVEWAIQSSFSNAGQRCASTSRIIVAHEVYSEFKTKFLYEASKLRVGSRDSDDFGPLASAESRDSFLRAVDELREYSDEIPVQLDRDLLSEGYFVAPRVFENLDPRHKFSSREVFGPLVVLSAADNDEDALDLANASPYGLTAAVHTSNLTKAAYFSRKLKFGVVNLNRGTHGSEPHFPFGGFRDSGNGAREPGAEALNVFTELKVISLS